MPRSLSRPRIRLAAGRGERRTRLVGASSADACPIHPSPASPRQLDRLKRLGAPAGRAHSAIEKMVPVGFNVGSDGSKLGEVLGQ
jgi:hypothetical protein